MTLNYKIQVSVKTAPEKFAHLLCFKDVVRDKGMATIFRIRSGLS